MAYSKDSVIRDVKAYLAELRRSGIPVKRALLFGSWARGVPREESDVDVALISDAFTGDRFEDRRRIVPLRRRINNSIEPMPFSQQTFDRGGSLVDEIIKYGEEIQ